jgi:cytochrome c553
VTGGRRAAAAGGAALLLAFAAAAVQAEPAAAPPGAASCVGCHGAAGRPGGGAIPSFAGWPAEEIAEAMRAYRTGERPATVMDRIARGFTEAESRAIAAWVAAGRR